MLLMSTSLTVILIKTDGAARQQQIGQEEVPTDGAVDCDAYLTENSPVFIPFVEALQGATELGKIQGTAKLILEGLFNLLLREHVGPSDHHTLDDRVGGCLQAHLMSLRCCIHIHSCL